MEYHPGPFQLKKWLIVTDVDGVHIVRQITGRKAKDDNIRPVQESRFLKEESRLVCCVSEQTRRLSSFRERESCTGLILSSLAFLPEISLTI